MILKTFHSLSRQSKYIGSYLNSSLSKQALRYRIFNLNKQPNNQPQQPKGHGRKNQSNQPELIPLDSIIFPFPFQWTLQANNFKYYDPRFTQQPIKKNLQPAEKEHILYVLENLEGYLNSGFNSTTSSSKSLNKNFIQSAIKTYLHNSLSSKLQAFLQSLESSEISIKLHISKDSIVKTQGYMQMQAKNIEEASLINFQSPKYIHEYQFEREKQLLLIQQKKQKAKKSQEELLKQDVKDMMDEKSHKKEVRQFFDEMQKGKTNDGQRAVSFLKTKLKEFANRKPQKKREQQRYATSQLIKGKINFTVHHKGNLICEEQTDLYTKWVYVVEQNEPESIKKSRKRILYDFQFWNRGSFFQTKDWVQEMGL